MQKNTSQPKKQSISSKIFEYISATWYRYWQHFIYTLREIRKRFTAYVLGVLSCFIVVFFVLIAASTLSQVPIVFLRLAEIDQGEFDVAISSASYTPGATLNYSMVIQNLKKAHPENYESLYSYHSPRHELAVVAYKGSSCMFNGTQLSLQDTNWMYRGLDGMEEEDKKCAENKDEWCVKKLCSTSNSATIHVIDTEREERMGFGRNWDHPPIPKGKAYIMKDLARDLNVTVGDEILVQYPTNDIFVGPYREVGLVTDETQSYDGLSFVPFKVDRIITDPHGKVGAGKNVAIFVEFSTFMEATSPYLHPVKTTAEHRGNLTKINMYEYTQQVFFNLPPNRIDRYNLNDYDQVQAMVSGFASKVSYAIGFNQVDLNFPLLEFMRRTRFFSLFLALIINIIITILTILSIILIYSLLMINVENRTFEMGVLRMIGLKLTGLIELILIQAFMYSIPAWLFGLILGEGGYIGVSYILGGYFQVSLSKIVTWGAVLQASILGIVIPIISAILPIANALGKNLHDSLDTNRSKTVAVKYEIERSSEGKISWTTVLVGLCMAAFGFGIYYAFPLSLLSFNITLMLYMFFGLLLAMLLGLIVLSLNLENIIEHIVAFVFFFWENYAVRQLTLKNLVAHRVRNRKTTIMYALSLGFIIFIAVSFNLQITTFRYEAIQQFGTRFNIKATSLDGMKNKELLGNLERLEKDFSIIRGHAYMSYPLHSAVSRFETPKISTIGQYKSADQRIRAVSPNFFSTVGTSFLKVTMEKPSGYSLDKQLYTVEGSYSMIIGELYRDLLDLRDLNGTFMLKFTEPTERLPKLSYFLMKPLAYCSAAPGITMSQFPSISTQDALVSFPTYVRMSQGSITTVNDIPIETMFIDIDPNASTRQIEDLKTAIRKLLVGHDARLNDVEDRLENLMVATEVMNFFFIFTTLIAMVMCFFSLISSMYTNINEQAKEIGILRAIGARKFFVWRVYVYEAFVLVVSASLMGIVIGTVVAYTMTIQRVLFTQLPIDFVFPWELIGVVGGCAIIFSILASLIPIMNLTRLSIVTILRRIVT